MSPTIREIMQAIPEHVDPAQAKDMNLDIQFKFTGADPYICYVHFQDGAASVHEGEAAQPKLSVTCKSEVWQGIISCKKDAFQAFMLGELQVKGDMGLALKLQNLFK